MKHAGFVSQALVASKNAIVNAYAFYIRGRKAGVPKSQLDEMIARWVFGTLLTARYSGSSETIFEEALPERERESLARALRARPTRADALSIVDYLYLGQLPPLFFTADVWPQARRRFGGAQDAKQRLQAAVSQIAPVRNEIAHVREVERDCLLRASVACADVLKMLQDGLAQQFVLDGLVTRHRRPHTLLRSVRLSWAHRARTSCDLARPRVTRQRGSRALLTSRVTGRPGFTTDLKRRHRRIGRIAFSLTPSRDARYINLGM